ncbi:MAG: ABC transporter substrate-binding protein [Roseiarcus sp.]
MTSIPGNPSEVPNSSPPLQETPSEIREALREFQEALGELKNAPPLPKASLPEGYGWGDGATAEEAPEAPSEPIVLPADALSYERGSGADGEAAARADLQRLDGFGSPPPDFVASSAEQSMKIRSRRGRRWLVVGSALAVAFALTMGTDSSNRDAQDRDSAMAAISSAQAALADRPLAAAEETEAGPTGWSDRAAQLQFATPALALTADAAPSSTDAADATSVVAANAAAPAPAPTATPSVASESVVRGVSDKEIRFGMAAPFSGAARELGRQMKIGVDVAFDQINDAGGVNGRQLRVVSADDGYEPTRTGEAMQELYDKDQVFGFIGNVGTPTAAVALPFALDRRTLFFGAFTGASILRRDPPDRYVFNYRASYAEETDAVVRYLVKVRRILPSQILVFAQQDSYGDSGYAGVAKAVRSLPGDNPDIVRIGYKRNTVDVQDAVNQLRAYKGQIKAVVMVAAYRAAAKFIEKTRDLYPSLIYTNVSFVGSTALSDELTLLGPRYANGVIVTQVVPAINSYSSIILKYKAALDKYFPGEAPDYVSLEGYIDASILAEAVKRVGPQINTEKLVDELERMRDYDMGLGTQLSFSPDDHQASHKVWGTQLDEAGHYQPVDLQ